MAFFYVTTLIALLIFWFFLRRRTSDGTAGKPAAVSGPDRRTGQDSGKFHAVTIRFGQRPCDAVKALDGERILSTEAPRLPLPECDRPGDCECNFVHHQDRRSGRDRRSPFRSGGISSLTGEHRKERRAGGERRHDEDDDF